MKRLLNDQLIVINTHFEIVTLYNSIVYNNYRFMGYTRNSRELGINVKTVDIVIAS